MITRQIFHIVAQTLRIINPFIVEAKWVSGVSAGLRGEAAMHEIIEVVLGRPITPCVADRGERQGGVSGLVGTGSAFGQHAAVEINDV